MVTDFYIIILMEAAMGAFSLRVWVFPPQLDVPGSSVKDRVLQTSALELPFIYICLCLWLVFLQGFFIFYFKLANFSNEDWQIYMVRKKFISFNVT